MTTLKKRIIVAIVIGILIVVGGILFDCGVVVTSVTFFTLSALLLVFAPFFTE
jgi:hypothetical protein